MEKNREVLLMIMRESICVARVHTCVRACVIYFLFFLFIVFFFDLQIITQCKQKLGASIGVGQWLVSGLQWSSSARQSLSAQQKELSE